MGPENLHPTGCQIMLMLLSRGPTLRTSASCGWIIIDLMGPLLMDSYVVSVFGHMDCAGLNDRHTAHIASLPAADFQNRHLRDCKAFTLSILTVPVPSMMPTKHLLNE